MQLTNSWKLAWLFRWTAKNITQGSRSTKNLTGIIAIAKELAASIQPVRDSWCADVLHLMKSVLLLYELLSQKTVISSKGWHTRVTFLSAGPATKAALGVHISSYIRNICSFHGTPWIYLSAWNGWMPVSAVFDMLPTVLKASRYDKCYILRCKRLYISLETEIWKIFIIFPIHSPVLLSL